jgi:outer membrane protein OmpA-like peptidoglycan-associated protein
MLFSNFYEFEFLNIPAGVRATGLGGNFVSMENSVEGLFYNPAIAGTLGTAETVLASHLYYNGSYDNQFAINFPFNKFGLGLTGKYFSTPSIPRIKNYETIDDYSLKSYYSGLQIGVCVARWLSIGFGTKYVNETMLESKNTTLYDGGFVLKTFNDKFSFSGAVENYNTSSYLIQSLYRVGFTIKLDLPQQSSKINFLLGSSIDTKTSKPVYTFGIEHWGSDVLGLRGSYVYDTTKTEANIFTPVTFFRAGISLKIKNFEIDYSYSPNQPLDNTHNIGINYKFKEFKVKEVKEIVKQAKLEVEPYYFSPNSDGYKDNIFFVHNATTTHGFVEWKFEIRDNSTDQVVDTISYSSETKKVDSLYVYNGKSQLTGNVLKDGVYNVKFVLTDTFNNQKVVYQTEKKNFVLDTNSPEIFLTISTKTVSPDNDGIDDTFVAELKVDDKLSPIENVNIKIYTLTDKQIKSYNLNLSTQTIKSFVTTIIWDCKDEVYNNTVPNGEYKIRVSVKDLAGNKSFSEEKFSVYVEKKPEVEVKEKVVYVKGAKVSTDDRGIVVTYSTDELFVKGKFEIDDKMYDSLASLAEVIKQQYPTNKIVIEGHTDSVGDENVNLQKSSSYAWAVYSYLVKHFSLDTKNLDVKGFGESKTIASNKTKLGRAQNRRIEIVILKQ